MIGPNWCSVGVLDRKVPPFYFRHAKPFQTGVHLWFKPYSLMFSDLLPKFLCIIAYTSSMRLARFMLGLGSSWELEKVQISQMPISASVPDRFTAVSISCLTSSPQPHTILWTGRDLWEFCRPVGVNRHLITVIMGQAGTGGPESLLSTGDAPSMTWHQHLNMQNRTQNETHLHTHAESSTHPLFCCLFKHTPPSSWRLANIKCMVRGCDLRRIAQNGVREACCTLSSLYFWEGWLSNK